MNAIMGNRIQENREPETPKLRVLCLGNSGAELWKSRADAEVAGVVNLYEEASKGKGGSEQYRLFADTSAALRELQPDVVYMTIPPWCKADMATIRTVVEAGYDLYLDKFRPADWQDADTLLQWAQATGRQIGIGDAYQFGDKVERVKQVVACGQLGKIGNVVWQCYRPADHAFWMEAYRHVMLEDLSYHHFGVMHTLLGIDKFQRVYAESVRSPWAPDQPPCVVSLQASGEEELRLHYYATWAAIGKSGSHLGQFRIEGSDGMIEVTDDRIVYVNRQGEVRQLEPVTPFPYAGRQGIIHECVQACTEARASVMDIRKMYPFLRFIRTALNSVEQGNPAACR